jgi:PPM family protein phosphatase
VSGYRRYDPAQLEQARVGDRYLLCSDGLHNEAPAGSIKRVLREVSDPDEAAASLIALAIDGGGRDNVTCIVADVVPADVPAPA